MNGRDQLKDISQRMKNEAEGGAAINPHSLTVRELLNWFGYRKRGSQNVAHIRRVLTELDLRTQPDFQTCWVDDTVSVTLDPDTLEGIESSGEPADPTVRVGAMDSAHREPTSVNLNSDLAEAVTLMQLNDYSQLPVMQDDREVKGIISWKSIAARLALVQECQFLRECIDPDPYVPVVRIEAPLYSAVNRMQQHGYVLVKAQDGRISGIVTWGDVTDQFRQLATPFLLIGEIEGYLRILVHRKFTAEEIQEALPNSDDPQTPAGPEDLTLGGYRRLLEHPERWERLGLPMDRRTFVEWLDWVREKRNDLMHFDPEGPESEDLDRLEGFAKFFRYLRGMRVL